MRFGKSRGARVLLLEDCSVYTGDAAADGRERHGERFRTWEREEHLDLSS
jgi:hypothetical protein